ncbi:MAG: hypothetical protein ACXIU8_06930 [Alkalilacustris sp.]
MNFGCEAIAETTPGPPHGGASAQEFRRRTTFATAAAAALAMAGTSGGALAEDRPDLTVAVRMILTSGTLEPLTEQSNVGARTVYSIFDRLIDRDWDNGGAMSPGLATAWKRIDDRTVELTLRRGGCFTTATR